MERIDKLRSTIHSGNYEIDSQKIAGKLMDFEFGLKSYKAGDAPAWHFHRVATEVTLIVAGEATMNGRRLRAGDIVVLDPGEGADFRCQSDVITAVIKTPSLPGDKYEERAC